MRSFLPAMCLVAGCLEPPGVSGQVFGAGSTSGSSDEGSTAAATSEPAADSTSTTAGDSTGPASGSSSGGESSSTGPSSACGDGVVDVGEICLHATAEDFAMGADARDLLIADLDLDGALDVVTLDAVTPALWLRTGDGARGFAEPVSWPVTPDPFRVLSGDFDLDGDLDLVVVGDEMTVFTSHAGELQPADFALSGLFNDELNDAVLGSFDNYLGLDLVHTTTISAYMQRGVVAGTGWAFGSGFATTVPEGASGVAAAVFAFDDDELADLLILNRDSATASIRVASGVGNFSSGGTVEVCPPGAGAYRAAIGDLDGDADDDLVVTCTSDDWTIVLGNGDGTFAPPFLEGVMTAFLPRIVDFDHDGDGDVAVSAVTFGSVVISTNDGTGLFDLAVTLDAPGQSWAFDVADLDDDGAFDVVVGLSDETSGRVGIFWGDP